MDYDKMKQNFENHGFATEFFSTKEDVKNYFVENLHGKTIGFGGSVSLREIGLYDALCESNAVVWHNKVEAMEVRRLANQASIYITSANAVTVSGEIVNIDGTGNRVAMTAFGPEVCYYVVGRNKITQNVEEALYRCRNVAAPKNAKRLNAKTPCAKDGDKCYNCNSPGRICRMTIVMDRAPFGMSSKVIFVDEDLGL